eukprot:6197506-Pleurochrysis_carterae.AAC.2
MEGEKEYIQETTKWGGTGGYHECRGEIRNVPNMMADNIAASGQKEAPEGMITGLISEQINSRPIIYSRKVQGRMELADSPIY